MSARARVGAIAIAVVVAVLALAPGASGAPARRVDGKLGDWRGSPSMVSGQTTLSRGELIYTDWLYDDFGADTDGLPSNSVAWGFMFYGTQGDYRYPTNESRFGTNAADLRELRLAADRKRLYMLVSLQTLLARDTTAGMLAIDTDGNSHTGAKTWPDGVGIDTPGADRFVTLWGTGGDVRDASGKLLGRPKQAVNLKDNAIEASVPRKLLGAVSPNARVWFVTGLADAAHGRFLPVPSGSPTATQPGGGGAGATAAFNVAFRPNEPHGTQTEFWSDTAQATALAKRDITQFSYPLQLGALRTRASLPFSLQPGYYNGVYRSQYNFGEGIDLQTHLSGEAAALGNSQPQFKSRYQPYGLYIPKGYHPGAPLTIVGHASLETENQWSSTPNLLKQLGDERGSVLITPLGRGHINFYLSAGLADVLEATASAQRMFKTDPLRTSITGYSMGGYLTFRLGLLMPDKFARASAYNPPPAYAIWPYPAAPVNGDPAFTEPGITTKIVENGLNLPYEIVAGDTDEEVPISGVRHQVDRFDALGNPYRFYEHPVANHTARSMADEWGQTRDWLGNYALDPNPAEVRYKRYPIMDLPQLRYHFDGAYWVDDLAVRSHDRPASAGPNEFGMVDATTYGLGKRRPATAPESFLYPGPPFPATVKGRKPVPGAVLPRGNAFDAAFTNLAYAGFDLGRMGLSPSEPIHAQLRGDGPITLWLSGPFPRVSARLDGRAVSALHTRHGLRLPDLAVTAGAAHQLEIAPAAP